MQERLGWMNVDKPGGYWKTDLGIHVQRPQDYW